VNEAAEILRVTPRTLRRWASEGRVVRHKLGGAVRFTTQSVEELIIGARDCEAEDPS
jgi:excisionase family DNA binding protein